MRPGIEAILNKKLQFKCSTCDMSQTLVSRFQDIVATTTELLSPGLERGKLVKLVMSFDSHTVLP